MIIWLDGTYGVGKTSVAVKIEEGFAEKAEVLMSDVCFTDILGKIFQKQNECKKFNCTGMTPQDNKEFIAEFKNVIVKKADNTDKMMVVDMALSNVICKEGLLEALKNEGKKVLHIILTADEASIRQRINNDKNRDKKFALDNLKENLKFYDNNYSDAIHIDTTGRSKEDVAGEIMEIICKNQY